MREDYTKEEDEDFKYWLTYTDLFLLKMFVGTHQKDNNV